MSQKEQTNARNKANFYRNVFLILILIFVGFIILSPQLSPFIIGIIVVIIWLLYPRYKIWSRGASGEESIAETLNQLNNDYIVINDVLLPGEKGNIDHIIFGKTGIFIIETKSHKGHIICQGDYWIQQKIGRRGTLYEPYIGSPSKQVKKNAILLRKFLKENFPKLSQIWIDCIVVFTDKNTTMELKSPAVTVLKIDKLLDYVKNNKSKISISQNDFSKIETIFQNLRNHYSKS